MTTASTHVLDAALGLPAVGLDVTITGPLDATDPPDRAAETDADGRIAWGEVPGPGRYRLEFATGPWFEEQGRDTFFPRVHLDVLLRDGHTHVALLLSPYAYTTYRGS